jgi:hypothetical protein
MRYEIAKAYANIATEQWTRFVQRYMPLEGMMVSRLLGSEPVEPDYEAAERRFSAMAAECWRGADLERARLAKIYNLCPDGSGELELSAGLGADDMVTPGYRDAEHYAVAKDDLRWNMRSQLLNVGRGNLAIATRYAAAANEMLKGLQDRAGAMASGAANLLGYLYDRNMAGYASNFTQSPAPGAMLGGMESLFLPMGGGG